MTVKNLYFLAVEVETQAEADQAFEHLLYEAYQAEPGIDMDDLREQVVASLVWTAGYYDEETRKRAGSFYGHKSPYRR